MASSTESKPIINDEETSDSIYSVEEEQVENETDTDQFASAKRKVLRTPSVLNGIVDQLHPDIVAKSHQSNLVLFPPKLNGCTVVDLGCGVGRDVFILSKLVQENGHVIGIDNEKEQLDVARHFIDYHMRQFQYDKVNVEFVEADIDQLEKTHIQPNSVDVVVSNSIINHRRNKREMIEGVCRILKPGGEFYFSDVYVNQAIPEEHQALLAGEYVGGALKWEDLILYATEAGFTQPRLVTAEPVVLMNEDIQKAIGNTKFVSAIFRCFKLPSKNEDENETYLNSLTIPYQLTYETPVTHFEDEFFFDHALQFRTGELAVLDDRSVALALSLSRYKDNFLFESVEKITTDDGEKEFYQKITTITTTHTD